MEGVHIRDNVDDGDVSEATEETAESDSCTHSEGENTMIEGMIYLLKNNVKGQRRKKQRISHSD